MLISVVIPFYNLERYVQACLDSVVAACSRPSAASAADVEVLCVDDGSTDGTPRLLDEYASRSFPQCPLLHFRIIHKQNGGEGSARNAGLDAAAGDWITFLDGDDAWLPNMMEEAVSLLAGHASADMVNMRFAPFEDGAAMPLAQPSTGASVVDLRDEIPDDVILNVGVYPTFFRRAALGDMRFGPLPLGADRLYVAQCLSCAGTVVMSDAVVHGYRLRAGSMARATWTVRKVNSQCDYSAGALTALAQSGRRIGRWGVAYLASLWLSDVPAHLRRLPSRGERAEAGRHWIGSWRSGAGSLLFGRWRLALRALKLFANHPSAAYELAHLFRTCGVT